MTMTPTLNTILAAHGGAEHWNRLERIEITFSAWGFLFTAKGIAPLNQARMILSTRQPEASFADYPAPGLTTRFLGGQRVEILDAQGRLLQGRDAPRRAFAQLRRQFRWDALDFAYFAGYAMWNYLTMPFLFLRPGVEVRELPRTGRSEGLDLEVTFPADLPTHCPRQRFHFDVEGCLLRHDYTAEVIGGWATAAHLSSEYRAFGGLRLPTRRRVYPKLLGDRPLPFPTLVAIDLHQVTPVIAST